MTVLTHQSGVNVGLPLIYMKFFLLCFTLGQTERLTFAHKNLGPGNLEQDPISAGYPSYVMQEEFNRYQGYWWQPLSPGNFLPNFRVVLNI